MADFNAGLAQWLIADGHAPASYVAAQGGCLGRAGRVHIESSKAAGSADLEVWALKKEAFYFREVFRRELLVEVA